MDEVKKRFFLHDLTAEIKDDEMGRVYYECFPSKNPLIGTAEQLHKLGDFIFVILSITDAIEQGYFKESLQQCKEESISYMDFCWTLVTNERLLKQDVMYKVLSD